MKERQIIEEELERLRYELSVVIPQEMQSAVELGDLKENSEFSLVISKQYFINVRLRQLTDRLKSYKEIDIKTIPRDAVGLGSIIKTRNLNEDKIIYFKVVMYEITDDADNKYSEITIKSPLGKAFSNKKVKDEVAAITPVGRVLYRILGITTIHEL